MKNTKINQFISLSFLLILMVGCKKEDNSVLLKIGDIHEGGLIFYLNASNEHGKVCNATDLGSLLWQEAIDTCESYEGDGYTDWYLPDRYELDEMFTNLHLMGLGGFEKSSYWSSTELFVWESAWQHNFNNSEQVLEDKLQDRLARAVRAF